MSFAIITDTTANLPIEYITTHNITVIQLPFFMNGQECGCTNSNRFNAANYYKLLRNGVVVTTSQITPQTYIERFTPFLQSETDILFVGMSSGISGSFHSAEVAKQDLLSLFPERHIRLIDSLGASLGEGLQVLKAAMYRDAGMTLDEAADLLDVTRHRMYQVFTVDDLMFLKRSGRVSGATALVGTMLQVKPILKGDENGKIVSFAKVRGRKRAMETLAEKYTALAVRGEEQTVGISHADCPEEAEYLKTLLCESPHPPKEIITVCHEPATGAHVGPGCIGIYFEGETGVRNM